MSVTQTNLSDKDTLEKTLEFAAVAFETQEGVIVTDACKIILSVNKAFTRITGYSAMETLGNQPSFLHSGRHSEEEYRAIWDTVSRQGYWQGEIWDRHRNGTFIPILLTISKVCDSNGLTIHYVGNFTDFSAQKKAERILRETLNYLEKQMLALQEALISCKNESAEMNSALNYVLKNQEKSNHEVKVSLSQNMNTNVLPIINKLKAANKGRKQTNRLIDILESNLEIMTQAYGSNNAISTVYQKLTPIETQIAALIVTGQPTKVIAEVLNIAPGTVNNHRKHIRKKLGLNSKAINLYGYMKSLIKL